MVRGRQLDRRTSLIAPPIVIAHRGACGYLPEHTLEAKAMAHAMGADYIEQDVVLTRDGVPVVLHDIHLDYTSDVAVLFPDRARQDGHFYALDFTLAEIRQLQALERGKREADGSWRAVYPGRYPRGKGHFSIATLEEEIQLISGMNTSRRTATGFYIELKAPRWHMAQGQDLAAAVLAVLERTGLADQPAAVYLQCFDDSTLKRLRNELNTTLPLIQLIGDDSWGEDTLADYKKMQSRAGLAQVAAYADGIGPWLPLVLDVTEDGELEPTGLVSRAHDTGLAVHPYTLRRDELPDGAASLDEVHQALFVAAGADGAFSDFPDLTRAFIDRHIL